MAGLPTYSTRPSFLGTANEDRNAAIVCAGVPFDIGTSHRAGTRFGPMAIRAISRMLVDGVNPLNWRSPSAQPFSDIGDFEIALGDTLESLKLIEAQAATCKHLMALGGDHSITLPLLRAVARKQGPVGLIHFDAHVDTWPETFGQKYGHGSVFYNAIEEGIVDPARMIQIGIRSPVGRDVWDWTIGKGVRILTAQDVHAQGPEAVVAAIKAKVGKGKTYLSFDIDALDPSQAPGTGTPEVAGLWTWQEKAILDRLAGIDFIGMDVVEVSPSYDVAEITALAAATIAWQYLSLTAPQT
jgi:agmatinase